MKNPASTIVLFCLLFTLLGCETKLPPLSEQGVDAIRLNQIGYYPATVNDIVITARPSEQTLYLTEETGEAIIATFSISDSLSYELAGETIWPASFTAPTEEGNYRLFVPGVGYSHPFHIKVAALSDAFRGSVKGLYYLRVSTALEEKYAGRWHRPMGHPDTAVFYHPSTGITSGQQQSTKGWYDAGDYNKYVVNGAFSVGQLISLYEAVGDPAPDGSLNIPESNNAQSDYLDEIKYELDWLLTMQDVDGGLFHKLTAKSFEGMVMPHEANSPRYLVGKGTAGTLDYAAVAAQAARVYANYDTAYAAKLLAAAEAAWNWAEKYPAVPFTNPYDISTGEYGDGDFTDEWYWAAAELFLSTQNEDYRNFLAAHPLKVRFRAGESWTGFMGMLGAMSLLRHPEKVPANLYNPLKTSIIALADSLVTFSLSNDYGQPVTDFKWGSNSDVLNAAMVVATAHDLSPKPAYLRNVHSCIDYVLGKNALGVSFLTGFGDQTPQFIHHRQSAADDLEAPVPGLLSGGPNSRQQDEAYATYPPDVSPMKSWVDQTGSYASNEICLNWNAPLSYILGWLEAQ